MSVLPFRAPPPPEPPKEPVPYVQVYLDDVKLLSIAGTRLEVMSCPNAVRTIRQELLCALATLNELFPPEDADELVQDPLQGQPSNDNLNA